MFITRLCLTNEYDCSDLLSFSQMLSFSPPVPLIKDVTHVSLYKTGNESATIDLWDSLQMLRHHWVVTWATNCFKAAYYLKYSFTEKKTSRNLVPSLVLLHHTTRWVPHIYAAHRYCKHGKMSMWFSPPLSYYFQLRESYM